MGEQTTSSSNNDATARDLRNHTERYAQLALKATFIINGGAAIAVLTFIGALLSKVSGASNVVSFANLTDSLTCFSAGVLLCAISTFFSYLAEYRFYSEKQKKIDRQSSRWTEKQLHGLGKVFSRFSSFLVFVSYVAFGSGVCFFTSSLDSFGGIHPVVVYK